MSVQSKDIVYRHRQSPLWFILMIFLLIDTIIMTQTQTIERQSERLDNLRLQLEETQRPRPLLDRLKAIFIPSNT